MKKWLSFVFQITLVGVVGSAAIMAGADRIAPEKALQILDKADALGYAKAEALIMDRLNAWLGAEKTDEERVDTAAPESLGEFPGDSPVTESHEEPVPTLPSLTPRITIHLPVEPPPQPAPSAAPPTPTTEWAVTQTTGARVYSTDGKFLRRIDAGTFVVVKKRQETSAGTMAVCDVNYEGRRVPNVVLRNDDIHPLPPSFASASRTEQRLVAQRARIRARIASIETEIAYGVRKDNPYYGEYVKARDAFKAFSDKIRPMRDAYDTATGAKREQLGEKLHAVRAESFQLGNAYRIAKTRYSQWNQQNPIDVDSLPEVAKLKGQLAHVNGQIDGLAGQ